MSDNSQTATFGRFRTALWPIFGHEHKKFIPLFLIFFLVSFNYNVLRTMKETLVVTAPDAGAEVIPFIKVWAMFPGAVILTFVYAWLSNRFSKETVLYMVVCFFLGYFLLFIGYLFPNHDALHLHGFADTLQAYLPEGFKGLIMMLRHWTFTSFYVMAELWGNIVLIVLFWGFVNQVTSLQEAKRFYGLFGFGCNISCIISSQMSVYFSKKPFDPSLPFGNTAWDQSLCILLCLVLVCGLLTLGIFHWLNKNVFSQPEYFCAESHKKEQELKGTMSVKESIAHMLKSKYLISIAVIVVAYNIVINLVEVLWKDQIRALYPNSSDYNLYINQVATWIGVIATLSALFVSSNSIRRFGWTFTALITPMVLLVTSIFFFGLLFGKVYLEQMEIMLFGMTPLALVVLVGSIQNVLSRGAKYTVFDATKEMAFVPLDKETKVKGKAIIDGIFNRLGKSGGSVIHQSLLIIFASFAITAPFVCAILFLIIGIWMGAVRILGRAFENITLGKKAPEEDAEIELIKTTAKNITENLVPKPKPEPKFSS